MFSKSQRYQNKEHISIHIIHKCCIKQHHRPVQPSQWCHNKSNRKAHLAMHSTFHHTIRCRSYSDTVTCVHIGNRCDRVGSVNVERQTAKVFPCHQPRVGENSALNRLWNKKDWHTTQPRCNIILRLSFSFALFTRVSIKDTSGICWLFT